MVQTIEPNLARVTGLIVTAIGVLLLAKVITSFAHIAHSEGDRAELTANRRTVGMWFCTPVLLLGLMLQIAAEYVLSFPTGAMALLLLGVAFWLIAFLLIEDFAAERMLDARRFAARHRRPPPEPTYTVWATPPSTLRPTHVVQPAATPDPAHPA